MADPSVDTATTEPRYHALDKLRWSMMALGLALHSAVSYMRTPLGELWPYQSPQTSFAFDALVAFIHVFRMPAFFAMAGFFGALGLQRYGARQFLRSRLERIGIPLVVGWTVICPTTLAGFAFARAGSSVDMLASAIRFPFTREGFAQYQLFHLWFLFDLLLYYGLVAVGLSILDRASSSWRTRAHRGAGHLLDKGVAPVALAVLTAMTLAPMQSGMLETPGAFIRPYSTLLANGVFFVFGWALFSVRDQLGRLHNGAWRRVGLGLLAFVIHLFAVTRAEELSIQLRALSIASVSLAIWLLVFALMGLYLRYGSQPQSLSRYAADASYWSYLIHLPLVIWGTGLLANVDLAIGLKFAIVLTGTVAVCILSYDLLARSTWIGKMLSGTRHRRGLSSLARARIRSSL